ncbi:MAG TPA: PQQ-dependent dehydrogenase, methanol/ethanol family [Bryobacteraceae bacterium]|nr:PQQ-dependent dehydrogenase, methanol/ethanol family [Bryobacteraceae bacterium]
MNMRYVLLTLSLGLAALWAQNGATSKDWPSYGGTQLAWRYSALDQINTSNVKKLVPVWQFQTGDYAQGLQSTPIVIDGVLYLSTTHSQVFALDAATGKMIWQYKYPMPRGAGGNIQNRGIAVGFGKVFVGTYDDYMVAIDQKTGVESWKVALADSSQCGCSITGAPLLVKDKVIVGEAGGDGAFRGFLTALDAKTGRLAWRFYTIPGAGEKGNETWKGDSWKYGGGATWMTGSFDRDLNLLYWGIGNAASDMYSANRFSGEGEGANLYTGSVVALDADTGKLKWYYQEIPKDVWDYDSAYECLLIDRPVRGVMRKLLVHINKSGYTWVLDRTNGEFLGAFPIVDNHTWLAGITEDGKILGRVEPVEGKATLICPGPDGGKSWNQVAYSPRTGFMYTPTLEICSDSVSREQTPVEGRGFLGGTWSHRAPAQGPAYSHIDAYDPVTGKRMWSVRYKYALLASMLATAGDLVFTGDPEGYFFALNARTGEKLWSFQTGAGNRGSAISYSVNGRQYIATPTGWGSIAGRGLTSIWPEAENFRPGSTLVVFALPESGQ